jgi:SAM-dependent methyltransferase
MRLFRDFFRSLKYKFKFNGVKHQLDYVYLSNSKTNQELKNLMDFYGSDKGGKNNHHNFAQYYSEIFYNQKNKIENFLEIGLGTNNINVASNMGINGKPLASLRAWRDYFKNANIYGADIDKKILKNEERISTYYVDQTNPDSIKTLFSKIGDKKFDVILEDGLHEYSANICFFENAINFLKDDGIYIIEDVYYKDQEKFIKYFVDTSYNFSIIDIFHKKNIANNCLVVIKKNEKL